MSDSTLGHVATEIIASQAPPPGQAKRWSGTRIAGYALMALWAVLGLGFVAYLYGAYDPDLYARYLPKLFEGLVVTLILVALSLFFGALLSVPFAFGRMSKNPVFWGIAYAYVYFFRGTPLIAQVFLVYYGAGEFRGFFDAIGLWWFFSEPFYCAVFTFSLNTSAYQAEILRGAIQSVPRGQWEGGAAMGLPKHVVLWKIILPQALITSLRPYGNEIVLMIKGSAIASIVTVFDLMGETRRAFSRTFDFQIYLWAAVIYLIMVETLRRVWDQLELRLTRHLKR